MNIVSRIEEIRNIALSITNVRSFKDLNVEDLTTDKNFADPSVTIFTEGMSVDDNISFPIEIGCVSQIDVENNTFRNVQDITSSIMFVLKMRLIDAKIITNNDAVEFQSVRGDNNMIGFTMSCNVLLIPCS